MKILLKKLSKAKDLPLPKYATDGSAGVDLFACVDTENGIILKPWQRCTIECGIQLCYLPDIYEAQIRSRSGLAHKHGISVLNAPGTIDSDYRGEIKVILFNFSDQEFHINRGMKIAQMVFAKYERVDIVESTSDSDIINTSRGDKGFGSTGLYAK